YFPDVLTWFADKDTILFCDFLTRWTTLKQLKRARRATLLSFFHDHHVRSQARIDERLKAIKSATPLTDDLAVILPNQLLVRALAFKWIRILYRCWQTRTPYDESAYLNALKRRGSPLLASMMETAKNI